MQHQNISSILQESSKSSHIFRGDVLERKVGSQPSQKVFTKRKRNCDLQLEFPVFSCKCVWEGRSRHAKHRCHSVHRGVWWEYLVSHVCGCCSGKTILLEASFGIFKYQQVFINVLVCQLVKLVVIFCEQAQLVGPGLTAA